MQYRHELRTLTYVTLDQANGGIVRNLTHEGIGVQAVAAVRPRQQVRVRFELRYPRVRIEARGEVVWSTFSGQCGIRFLDMPPRMSRQIDEWVFGNLIEGATFHPEHAGVFAEPTSAGGVFTKVDSDDGLMLSAAPHKVIELPVRSEAPEDLGEDDAPIATAAASELDWLSQPLTGRGLAWTVNTLVIFAAMLLFALIFLSITRAAPRWPWGMALGAIAVVCFLYWGFFRMFGGASPGARLARLAESDRGDQEPADARFR